uniref:Uncharacterized protein n=1 Tax=Amphimedon queenslandica TaxID=400682 RepID=A0A1X7V8Q7_AMPQE
LNMICHLCQKMKIKNQIQSQTMKSKKNQAMVSRKNQKMNLTKKNQVNLVKNSWAVKCTMKVCAMKVV